VARCTAVFCTLAHSPVFAKRVTLLAAAILGQRSASAREREIVILRMGSRCESAYKFSEQTQLGSGRPSWIPGSRGCPGQNGELMDDDEARVALVDELYEGNAGSDRTWERLTARWSDEQRIEAADHRRGLLGDLERSRYRAGAARGRVAQLTKRRPSPALDRWSVWVSRNTRGAVVQHVLPELNGVDVFVLGSPVRRASFSSPLKFPLDRLPRGVRGETEDPIQTRAVSIALTGPSWHHYLALDELSDVLAELVDARVLTPVSLFPWRFAEVNGFKPSFAELARDQGEAS
jgi:hypothetical protein